MAGSRGEVLAASYDLLMFDLDGVVYVDGHAVDHAAESIAAAREGGAHIAFITNNASRTPQEVATHLRQLGITADPGDVVTSVAGTRVVSTVQLLNAVAALKPGSQAGITVQRGAEALDLQVTVAMRPRAMPRRDR